MPASTSLELVERAATVMSAKSPKGRRYRARIIEGNRQGSSGYYSEAMLRRDGAKAFPAGTQVYSDHPSLTEREDRPERSVRDLAGKLVTAAKYERDGLYAEVEFYPHWADIVEAMADDIGLSIRAYGTAEASTDPAIAGPIITALEGSRSVDLVTMAGAGGKLVSLLESARAAGAPVGDGVPVELAEARNIGAWLEAQIHRDFTCTADNMYGNGYLTREERITLSGGIGDALKAFIGRVEADAPSLFARDIWSEPDPTPVAVSESGDTPPDPDPPADAATPPTPPAPTEPGASPFPAADPAAPQSPPAPGVPVTESTPNPKEAVPVTTPDPTTGAPPSGGQNPYTIESVENMRRKVGALETELTEARAAAEAVANDRLARVKAEEALNASLLENARFRAMESARSMAQTALNSSGLPDCVHSRVVAAVCGHDGAAIPLSEASREIDTEATKGRIAATVDAWKVLVGQILESAGMDGRVRGLGAPAAGEGAELSEAQLESRMKDRFIRQGYTEAQALTAARGRG